MNSAVKVISTTIKNAIQWVKFQRFGRDDVQEKRQITPPGVDASPTKDMIAIYSKTTIEGDEVIIGYINKHCIAKPGEHRIFSTNENGELQTYIHLQDDGITEIGGDADNAVRFSSLKTGLNNQDTAIDAELTKIAAAINAIAPGSYTPTPISTNIDPAKIDEIKVP